MVPGTPKFTGSRTEPVQERRLPAHQALDQGTLDWISQSRPLFRTTPSLPRQARMLIPETTWFSGIALADSIHGIRHNARVSLLASALALAHGLDRGDTAALLAAVAVHDCRRRDDRSDPGHGHRAALWFTANADAIAAALGLTLTPRSRHHAAAAVSLHDVPYDVFTAEQDLAYQDSAQLVDLLKAADCLDRYRLPRLPRLHWWPDPGRLRVTVPAWLHPAAFDLMVRSEQAPLDGATPQQGLRDARRALTRG